MSRFLRELTVPPPPLTRGTVLVAGAIVVAISRWFALSKSQLDWDESLFAGGVRNYDVIAQNPHPPGYPLFILFAKIVRLFVHDDGRGFDARKTREGSQGIVGMRERAHSLGGSLRVRSQPGRGTLVTAEVPLAAEDGA